MLDDDISYKYAHECEVVGSSDVAAFRVRTKLRTAASLFTYLLTACMFMMPTSILAQTSGPSVFSDLSTEYDGGVANPTDGSTGNVLQQTLFAAYFWSQAHWGARATVVVESGYPIVGTRILVPGGIDLVCSSYSPHTYAGGCPIAQSDPGSNTASSGSPLLFADYRFGVLADHKTLCSTLDNPQQPGCTLVNSAGSSIRGFSLSGKSSLGGGADVGIRVFADGVDIEDTNEQFFGGPGIQVLAGINNSVDWNFGTNVDMWWCANPSQITDYLGGIDLGGLLDGEASNNQYSTGCAFVKGFRVSLDYPYLASMKVGGAGNLIQANLLQVDGIGLIVTGGEHRITENRVEYQAREAIRSTAYNTLYSENRVTSACLDPNLINLRPGSLDNELPLYPTSQMFLHTGYIIMDPNGNIEQVISAAGTSDANAPDWAVQPGGTTVGDQLTWLNIGPWKPGLTDSTDPGSVPALVNGSCYDVNDSIGTGNSWNATQISGDPGIDGYSYERGGFLIPNSGFLTANRCGGDYPDAYGNGQCWWGGDLFVNGAPAGLQPNGQAVKWSGGGTAWVGDYSTVILDDQVPRHYDNFQGMADPQTFSVTSSTVANVIDPWSIDGKGGGVYGHISVGTCTGGPLVVLPGHYYQFHYDLGVPGFRVMQMDCDSGLDDSFASMSPGTLTFAAQEVGTTSVAQTVTITNISSVPIDVLLASADDFSQTNSCGNSLGVGANCEVSVTFNPTSAVAHAGELTVTNGRSGSSLSVSLTGTGLPPSNAQQGEASGAITLYSSLASLQITGAGQSVSASLTATPQNGFTGTVNLNCQIVSETQSNLTQPLNCSVSPAQFTLTSGSAESKLIVSMQESESAIGPRLTTQKLNRLYRAYLAGFTLLGLLPLGVSRRKSYLCLLCIVTLTGMIGCGYVPSTRSGTYKIVVTATSGTQSLASTTIQVQVK